MEFQLRSLEEKEKTLEERARLLEEKLAIKELEKSLTKTESVEKLESRINELEQGLTCQRKLWLFQNRSGLVLSKAKTATILGSSSANSNPKTFNLEPKRAMR